MNHFVHHPALREPPQMHQADDKCITLCPATPTQIEIFAASSSRGHRASARAAAAHRYVVGVACLRAVRGGCCRACREPECTELQVNCHMKSKNTAVFTTSPCKIWAPEAAKPNKPHTNLPHGLKPLRPKGDV